MSDIDHAYRRIGTIGRPHGVRGAFVLNLEADIPDWVAEQPHFYVPQGDDMETWEVERVQFVKERLVFTLASIPDRNKVEELRGTALYVSEGDAQAAVEDDPDFFYNSDLVGCSIYSGGHFVGTVSEVQEGPAQNLLNIKLEDESSFLFPFVDDLIDAIDIDNKRIDVTLPKGLVSINHEKKEKKSKPKSKDA